LILFVVLVAQSFIPVPHNFELSLHTVGFNSFCSRIIIGPKMGIMLILAMYAFMTISSAEDEQMTLVMVHMV
jgi:hypothetical protein